MTIPKDAYRRFQEELAALDRKEPAPEKLTGQARLERAKTEFLALQKRFGLSIADVVSFFPEEEGIGYLQQLIVANETKPKRGRKPKLP
ncbi:2-hydroxyacyl-CoA dehydratase [Dyella subtropica]|uniref:2-hydroxyacyl-CoA dehydratase n=1 Tax=Dyella subtropica TaxID=2992127 RepID=UPI0022586D4A|nr:2-hydroxyacyl-CoA dehydratase [Dyella subtropica]